MNKCNCESRSFVLSEQPNYGAVSQQETWWCEKPSKLKKGVFAGIKSTSSGSSSCLCFSSNLAVISVLVNATWI